MGGALFPQEDMRLALDEGRSVLESIREPLARGPEQSPNQDQLDSQSTVQRLLAQLNETEAAFDEFWAKHQQKLEQCLQLRHFEQDFREDLASFEEKSSVRRDVGGRAGRPGDAALSVTVPAEAPLPALSPMGGGRGGSLAH
ncbi:hypothetical protein J1605_009365 [Eschrichtius robustus]|uniref:Uncharacterized protein n=1 Tax=Eschrichtius robustus TaxID=9764 RepID=A0AB34GVU4_ESCRO|nr:hypothetical protein J1605_009365 [Eschrichtius robustus]